MNKTMAYGSTACNTYVFCYVEQGGNRSLLTDNAGTGNYFFDRGFTGHCLFRTGFGKHLDAFKLMNIASPDYEVSGNGSMYCLSRISGNPLLGRMLSPDPFIQDPSDNQTFNRYSYCLNNPMMYTDPSGYYSDFSGSGNGGYYINDIPVSQFIFNAWFNFNLLNTDIRIHEIIIHP